MQWHTTNAGSDTRPVVWKLEGNEVLAVAASVVVGIAAFRYLITTLELSIIEALSLALLIPGFTLFVILKFVNGKAPSFGKDMLHWQALKWRARLGMSPSPLFKPTNEVER